MAETVLVTGAHGFLGSHVVTAVRTRWPTARVVTSDLSAREGSEVVVADLTLPRAAEELLAESRPEVVFHMAGPRPDADEEALELLGAEATLRLFEAVSAVVPSATVVVPGSAAEYGDVPAAEQPVVEERGEHPRTPYGRAKLAQTCLMRDFAARGLRAVSGRVFNPVGPGASPATLLGSLLCRMAAASDGATIVLGDLSAVRDLVHVADVADALVALAERGTAGQVFNVCTGVGTPVRELVEEAVRACGRALSVDEHGARSAASEGVSTSVGSPAKIERVTGWVASRDWRAAVREAVTSWGTG